MHPCCTPYLSRLSACPNRQWQGGSNVHTRGCLPPQSSRQFPPHFSSPLPARRSLPRGHPFAQLTGTDNMLVFTTQRYHDRPLVVQGPGAGTAVTAAGIFSDIIQVVRAHRHAAAA